MNKQPSIFELQRKLRVIQAHYNRLHGKIDQLQAECQITLEERSTRREEIQEVLSALKALKKKFHR